MGKQISRRSFFRYALAGGASVAALSCGITEYKPRITDRTWRARFVIEQWGDGTINVRPA